MKAYITKYALTEGIQEKEGDISKSYPTMFRGEGFGNTFHGKDWHLNREDALKQAEAMRLKKIASLKKQIQKLENLKFD